MSKSVEKVNTQSKDIFVQELDKFSKIFPQFVSEGKVDFDALKKFLESKDSLADEKDKYTFSWAGKDESFKTISRPSYATLNPKPDESVDFDNTKNLFIEGDNLEVLKLLQTHYHGKIKMIYIDPPYNTGNDFIYKDNFKEGKSDYFERIGATKDGIKLETNSDAHGRYHSQWLSMMYPRLFLAKQLLTDDGVIFISIDDNEQHHLKMLMNEIFSEENFVSQFVVQTNPRGRSLDRYVAKTFEYVICYAKVYGSDCLFSIPKSEKALKEYNKVDKNGKYRLLELRNRNPVFNRENRPNLYYPIYIEPKTGDVSLEKSEQFNAEALPLNSKNEDGCWTWGVDKVRNEKGVLFGKKVSTGSWRVYRKDYIPKAGATTKEKSLWLENNINHENGKEEIGKLFETSGNKVPFDFPKSVELIKKCARIATKKEGVVLDFFAGSATTGHAVMDLNKQDNGKRKFILVQIPEAVDEKSEAHKTIADIGKDRLRKAIEKNDYKEGFKVFSLAPTNHNIAKDYDGDDEQELLQQEISFTEQPLIDNFEPINLVYEIILKQGFSLNSKIKQQDDFYIVEDTKLERKLIITLANTVDTNTIETLKLTTNDILVCLDTALTDTQKVNFSRNFNLKVI